MPLPPKRVAIIGGGAGVAQAEAVLGLNTIQASRDLDLTALDQDITFFWVLIVIGLHAIAAGIDRQDAIFDGD